MFGIWVLLSNIYIFFCSFVIIPVVTQKSQQTFETSLQNAFVNSGALNTHSHCDLSAILHGTDTENETTKVETTTLLSLRIRFRYTNIHLRVQFELYCES